MTNSRSFKKPIAEDLLSSSDPDDDEPIAAAPAQPAASRGGKAPAARQQAGSRSSKGAGPSSGAKTSGVRRQARASTVDEEERDLDLDLATSSHPQMSADDDNDAEMHQIVRRLLETAAKKSAKADAKIEQDYRAARQEAFDESAAKIQEVKAKGEAEVAAAVAAADKKLGASKRRIEEASAAFEADCSQLLSDIKSAVKKAKTASAESDRDMEGAKLAMERCLKTHKADSDKIIDDLEVKQREILTRELNLGGVIREIALVASALEQTGGR